MQKELFIKNFKLQNGQTIKEVPVSWQQHGQTPTQDNVIVFLHGISSSHQALSPKNNKAFNDAGWGEEWIGPYKALDTNRFCILVPNALGSSFGTLGPSHKEGEYFVYGQNFPHFTLDDAVNLQLEWLKQLGINQLRALLGYSYGGYQAFIWALKQPLNCQQVVVLASAFQSRAQAESLSQFESYISNWKPHELSEIWTDSSDAYHAWLNYRLNVLKEYGYLEDETSIRLSLQQRAEQWAIEFDPLSMLALRRSTLGFNLTKQLTQLKTPVLWMLADSDQLFPGQYWVEKLNSLDMQIPIKCISLKSNFGHGAPIMEAKTWSRHVKRFLIKD